MRKWVVPVFQYGRSFKWWSGLSHEVQNIKIFFYHTHESSCIPGSKFDQSMILYLISMVKSYTGVWVMF